MFCLPCGVRRPEPAIADRLSCGTVSTARRPRPGHPDIALRRASRPPPGEPMSLRRPARSFDLHQQLTTLFVCAVATVVFTRAFLAATGYPQVGGGSLHIAHVLYGGLLLTAAVISMLAFLSPAAKSVAAVAGGIGFGLFIDEVGKFVTKNVNYFYRPAIAIIYICFVVLFGVIRWLARRRFTAEEATLIGLESLQRAAAGGLSDERRAQVLHLLATAGADSPLVGSVRELLARSAVEAERRSPVQRLSTRLAPVWDSLTQHRLFRRGTVAVLIVAAAISAVEVGWLLRHGVTHLSFSQRAFVLTTVVADCALIVGAVELRRSLLSALRWFEHAVLIEITVGQVFLYTSEQLAATLNLVALLLLWSAIRWAIHREAGKHAQRALGDRPLESMAQVGAAR
jgi:hypothetical protein